MILRKNTNDFKKLTSIFTVFIFLVGSIFSQSVFALNNSGNKAVNFIGYRITDKRTVKIWVDKNVPSVDSAAFKVLQGSGTDGQQVGIQSASILRESNITGVSGLGGGADIVLTTSEDLISGQIYTVEINNTVKANNGLTLGQFTAHKDIIFSFTVPDTIASPNCNSNYTTSSSIVLPPVVLNTWPQDGAANIPVEGNIWISESVPVANYQEVKDGLVLKKNGQAIQYDTTIDTIKDGDIYAPIVTDDHTLFFFPMTGSGSNYSYNLDADAEYELTIPDMTFVTGQTIPQHTITFHTGGSTVATKISSVPSASQSGDNLQISWTAPTQTDGISPAPFAYNVYASTDKYWNYVKLNSLPISKDSTSFSTYNCGLIPNTTYYFRVTALSNTNVLTGATYDVIESGFSDAVQATTLADTTPPDWPAGSTVTDSNVRNNSLTLNWTAAQDNYGVQSYNIYEDGNSTPIGTVSVNTTNYNVIGLNPETNYTFKIEAGDGSNNWSTTGQSITVKTTANPVTPGAPDVTANDTTNTVTGMAAGMEYRLDGADYVAYDATTFSAIDFSGDHTLLVRVAAEGINPAGLDTALTFTTNPTTNSGSGSSGSSSSGSGSGGGSSTVNTSTSVIIPVVTKTDSNSNVVATLDASKIKNNVLNEIQIQEPKPESKIQVQIPTSAVANGTASFEIDTNSVKLGIPAGVIDASSLSSGATLQLSKNVVPDADANALLANVPEGNKSIGKVFALNMAVCDSNNNVVKDIHNFASGKSVTVTIKLSSDDIKGMDTSKISAFYFDTASKSWVDIGGSFDEKSMTYTFNTTHFTDFTIIQSNIKRLAGLDRIETSIAIAKEEFKDKAPDAVVLTTANGFPDALSGEGLAYKYNAPMLLVNKSVNDSNNVLDYITSTLSKGKNIYILGGTGVVSADISDYLTSQGYNIIRIGGSDRYETNQKVVDNLNVAKGTSIVLASGNDFADALSVSSIAALKGYPVLLSGKDNLSANAIKDITNIQPANLYIIGGTGALSADIEAQIKNINGNINIVRLGGNDRYETSMKIVDYFNLDTDTITVASGRNFPDALSGSVLAAKKKSGILLVDNTDITKQKELLSKHGIKSVIVLGGEGVISSDTVNSLIQK